MDDQQACFSYYCGQCQAEHSYPIPPDGFPPDTQFSPRCGETDYPEFPSVAITIAEDRYVNAIQAVKGTRKVFFDGQQILVPESDAQTVSILLQEFGGTAVYGQAREFEYATKAVKSGVSPRLVTLGHALGESTGLSADEAVRVALERPAETLIAWQALATRGPAH